MILFDWLTYTSKVDSVSSIQKQLGLSSGDWVAGLGMNGYRDGWYLGSIAVWYNPSRDNMPGICVNLSGQGCRELESLSDVDWKALFQIFVDFPDDYNITRLDIAYDETEGILPLEKIAQDTRDGNFVSPFSSTDVHYTNKGLTVSVGSPKSEAMIRMYDKAAERGYDDGRHWVRVELQLRRERAVAFVQQYIYGGFADDLGELWKSVVLNYLRFVIPQKNDSNSRRWPMRKYWKKLMDSVEAVTLYQRPGSDYNVMNLHNFVTKQCAGAIDTFVRINSWATLHDYIDNRKTKLNPKYERLLAEMETKRKRERHVYRPNERYAFFAGEYKARKKAQREQREREEAEQRQRSSQLRKDMERRRDHEQEAQHSQLPVQRPGTGNSGSLYRGEPEREIRESGTVLPRPGACCPEQPQADGTQACGSTAAAASCPRGGKPTESPPFPD